MSRVNSLKVCVPFLDQNAFEIVWNLPMEYRVTRKQTKYAPRQAARKYSPNSVISFGVKDRNYDYRNRLCAGISRKKEPPSFAYCGAFHRMHGKRFSAGEYENFIEKSDLFLI